MEFVANMISTLSGWFRPYAGQISIAIVATLLVIYGSSLNRFVKLHIQHYHFLVRTLIFILLCTFGYGLLSIVITPYVKSFIAGMSAYYLAPVIVLVFFLLGFLAERQRV